MGNEHLHEYGSAVQTASEVTQNTVHSCQNLLNKYTGAQVAIGVTQNARFKRYNTKIYI